MTQSQWKQVFADNLVDILQEKGMTQTQLSKDSGVSMAMISDYINKRSAPGIFAVINMAYALDMDVGDFIDFGDRVNY